MLMPKLMHMKNKSTSIPFLAIAFIALFLSCYQDTIGQVIVNTNPASPFTVPANVSSIKVELWGGGGAGGGCATLGNGSGGGGGAYSTLTVAVNPGETYLITKGNGGTAASNANGTAGTASTFST